ncbi:hypothetical protein HDC93_004490 [Streptomyces sp. AK010]|nr:hypothetical protein [Streptomyces sp. AK010]
MVSATNGLPKNSITERRDGGPPLLGACRRAWGRVQGDRGEGRGEDEDHRGADDAEHRAEGDGLLAGCDPGGPLLVDDGLLGLLGRLDHVLRHGDEDAAPDPRRVAPGGHHGGQTADDAHEDDPAEVHVEEAGGGDRAGMRRQEGVRHGQAREQGQAVEQDRFSGALGGGVDDRGQDEDADVEEDRDAEDQAREAHGERGALLAEQSEQTPRQYRGAAADFEDRAEHGAQADDDRDMAEDAAHAGLDGGDGVRLLHRAEEFGDRQAGGEADGYGDREQGDERLESRPDDEEQQQHDAERGGEQESGRAVDEEEQSSRVGWGLGSGGRGERMGHSGVLCVKACGFGVGGSAARRIVAPRLGKAGVGGWVDQPRTANASISMRRPAGSPT